MTYKDIQESVTSISKTEEVEKGVLGVEYSNISICLWAIFWV